ncbi:histidine triad nucleotide-binding protein [Candidatus Eisenbacteria bacterium]|uniref:Histidine triad nucleotide-binding protein n=1 Tax=Eiseniibacteriota bacterium TaxID=2212470 RepID=A0ABV6YJC7_UNCEI
METDKDCIFCKIVAGDIPAEKVYEDEKVLGFKDLNPVAPFHALLIPKEHIATLRDLHPEHDGMMGGLMRAASEVAVKAGLDEGHRVVGNCLKAAGQEVYHIHLHVIGGRQLKWPPG